MKASFWKGANTVSENTGNRFDICWSRGVWDLEELEKQWKSMESETEKLKEEVNTLKEEKRILEKEKDELMPDAEIGREERYRIVGEIERKFSILSEHTKVETELVGKRNSIKDIKSFKELKDIYISVEDAFKSAFPTQPLSRTTELNTEVTKQQWNPSSYHCR